MVHTAARDDPGIRRRDTEIRDRRSEVQALQRKYHRAGETSPYSLYSESLASFTTGELYDHHDADGFINLFGLPLKVRAMKMQELKNQNNH